MLSRHVATVVVGDVGVDDVAAAVVRSITHLQFFCHHLFENPVNSILQIGCTCSKRCRKENVIVCIATFYEVRVSAACAYMLREGVWCAVWCVVCVWCVCFR